MIARTTASLRSTARTVSASPAVNRLARYSIGIRSESMVAKNAKYGDFPVRVEKVEPPTYLAYRWASAFPGEELREDNSTLVEFTLTPEGDATRLRVVESGFAALAGPEELRGQAVQDNTGGWPQELDALKTRAEQVSG